MGQLLTHGSNVDRLRQLERNRRRRCCDYVRRCVVGLVAALISVAALVACNAGGHANSAGASSPSSVHPTADRPGGGTVVRTCGSHYAADFDAGVESRIVTAGSVSLVGFRVSPVPSGSAPVKTFKMMVRLSAGTVATVETMTEGTSLLYDRARFESSNIYALSDGDRSVRFNGCPEQSAVFNGAVLTAGPRTVALKITVDGRTIPVEVSAFGG